MPSQQNLGIILENEMSENWYYFENLSLFTKYNDFLGVQVVDFAQKSN